MAWRTSKTRATQLCGGVFAVLSLVLLLTPHIVLAIFDLESAISTEIIAKRIGILFAGLAYLSFSTATHPCNVTKDRTVLLLVGLAILGVIQWMQGRVGFGIWIAIGTEILFAGLLLTAKAEGQGQ